MGERDRVRDREGVRERGDSERRGDGERGEGERLGDGVGDLSRDGVRDGERAGEGEGMVWVLSAAGWQERCMRRGASSHGFGDWVGAMPSCVCLFTRTLLAVAVAVSAELS